MTTAGAGLEPAESWDTLNFTEPQQLHWTTDNVGEAAPGVLTPLSYSIWHPVGDSMSRRMAYELGVYSRRELKPPSEAERVVHPFYGRIAMQVEFVAALGDRMPGTSGEEVVTAMFGTLPPTLTFSPTVRRYPVVAIKSPIAFARARRRVNRLAPVADAWWREQIPRLPGLSKEEALALYDEAFERFDHYIKVHSVGFIGSVRPLYDGLEALVERAGVGDAGLLSGTGGAEMAIVESIWQAGRGEIGIDDVIREHGFHGPLEGELSSKVWREDPEPLRRVIAEYAERDESENPLLREEETRRRAQEMRAEVLAALPPARRPGARLLLNLAAKRIPMRGVGKRSFLQAFDVARGAARRFGEHLADAGTIAEPDDVFFLTRPELGTTPDDAAELVRLRRERRAEYESLSIPSRWQGTPEPERIDSAGADGPELIEGVGVSSGVVEGVARVVTDPSFTEVEADEILVSPTTDPSWASIMFVSSALVVDIGGAMSHAAVVARELGIPCVVNTRSGSRSLRTGDRVRVDGSAGTVEVLERAEVVS